MSSVLRVEVCIKTRLHLDVYLAGEAAAEARRDELVSLGGTALARHHDFWLMADPAGNEFCLCWEHAGAH